MLADVGEELEPVHVRHLEVGEDEVERLLAEHLDGGERVADGRDLDAAPGEQPLDDVAERELVVDEEDARARLGGLHGGGVGEGKGTRRVRQPFPDIGPPRGALNTARRAPGGA